MPFNKHADEVLNRELQSWPDVPTLTLARKIYDEHPKMFSSLESVRSMIRYRRGNKGEELRGDAKKRHFKTFRPNGKAGMKYTLPESLASPPRNVLLPDGKILVLSDIHIPYHDQKALETALDYGDRYQPDTIYLNGDAADFFSVSRWETNPEERNLARELSMMREFLYHIRERFPNANLFYKIGNHEERWQHYLWKKAPELVGVSEYRISRMFDFDKLQIREVKGKQRAKAGNHLTILHGHELPGAYSPVNFARTLQQQMGVCALAGHRHQTSEHAYKRDNGEFVHCFSVGCLCDMRPDYATVNRWNHGFATIELKGNRFEVDNKRIVDGDVF